METSDSMRHRKSNPKGNPVVDVVEVVDKVDEPTVISTEKKEIKKKNIRLPNYVAYLTLIFGLLSVKLCAEVNKFLPDQVTLKDEFSQAERFVGQRAESFLKRLTDIGTRVVGSYENEVLAVDLLQREISFIIQQSNKIHKIETDIQKPTGSYYLYLKPHQFRNYYANIQNIVVRFRSSNSSEDSVLLNCHYDTVPESPGASDNGLNCAVLMEILTKLSKSKEPLKNTVIFLFNGAEENPLQASHGFITQHKWSKDVKAVINLDSAGAGGREVLFQTTASFPWLVKAYAKAAPRPSGGVHAEELFLSGIIPSDTDFRIFRDFGNVPGLDFAHVQNGYVYHTKFDSMQFIEPGVIQHTGDNILALVKELASSEKLGELFQPEENVHWRVVYFDVFGLYMVVYSELYGILLNVCTSLLSFYVSYRTFSFISKSSNPCKEMLFSSAKQFCSWLLTCAMLIVTAKMLDVTNSTMSWYGRPWFIIPLYVFPLIFISALTPTLNHMWKKNEDPAGMVIRYMNGNQILWTVVLLVGTACRIRTSFIIMMFLLPSLVGNVWTTFSEKHFSETRYINTNVICSLFSVLFILNQGVRLFTTLIPMTARMGPQAQPEMIIAGLVIIIGVITTSHLVPVMLILEKPKSMLIVLFTLHVLTVLAVVCTPFGFPYSGDISKPAMQRFYVLHCERTFFDSRGNIRKTDSGIFVQSLDRNNLNYIVNEVPKLGTARSASPECVSELNCGVPIYTSRFINCAPHGYWVEADAPVIHHPTSLEVTSKLQLDVRSRRMRFFLTGPDHITLLISPRMGVRLVRWTFDDGKPMESTKWINRDVYMVYYSHGLMGGVLEFDLDFEIDPDVAVSDSIADIAVIGHYMHDGKYHTAEFRELISQFPGWAHVTPWTTTYKSWVV